MRWLFSRTALTWLRDFGHEAGERDCFGFDIERKTCGARIDDVAGSGVQISASLSEAIVDRGRKRAFDFEHRLSTLAGANRLSEISLK